MVAAKGDDPALSCPRPCAPGAFPVLDVVIVPPDSHAELAAAVMALQDVIQV